MSLFRRRKDDTDPAEGADAVEVTESAEVSDDGAADDAVAASSDEPTSAPASARAQTFDRSGGPFDRTEVDGPDGRLDLGALWMPLVEGMELQLQMDEGQQVSLAWQTLPYLLLTFGEVLVSATALEFAYSQAPMAMKGVIMAFWYLTSTFGGLWVMLTNASVRDPAVIGWIQAQGWTENAFLMFFFAGFAFVAALAFALYARTYPMQDNYRTAA